MITIKVEGVDAALRKMARLGDEGKRQATIAAAAMAEKVRGDAIKAIQRGPKTGRVYVRGAGRNLSAQHRASAPGEAPASDTGNLVASAYTNFSLLSAEVGFRAPYAFWLEYGTLNIAPRPFLTPAVERNRRFFEDRLSRGMERAAEEFNK